MNFGLFRRLFKKEPEEEISYGGSPMKESSTRGNRNPPPKVPRPSIPPPPQRGRPNNDRQTAAQSSDK